MKTTATNFNFDPFLARLRERAEDDNDDFDGRCESCGAALTIVADLNAGRCTQCLEPISSVDDESADEHLHGDDEDLNGWELGYDD